MKGFKINLTVSEDGTISFYFGKREDKHQRREPPTQRRNNEETEDEPSNEPEFLYIVQNVVVRRLTPIECERLQGYPDVWTDIGEYVDSSGKKRKTTDTKRYTAIGNSIALPFWFWLMRRISAQYPRPATLGSLFDGIGGFPLVWERCNGKGTAIWASEINEFCIAVTKKHFPEVKE